MNLRETRRANLELLIADVFLGRAIELARRIGRSESQVSQWRMSERKDGRFFGIGEHSARRIEQASGKPQGWMDVPHKSGHEGLTIQDSVAPVPYSMRPSLRVALEVLCEELSRLEDPARLEGVAALLRSCAVSSGDQAYIEPILTLMRFKSAPPRRCSSRTRLSPRLLFPAAPLGSIDRKL